MMRCQIRWFCVLAGIVLAAESLSQAGTVSYPALGNIDPRQGTIEMWITTQFDPVDSELLQRQFWAVPMVTMKQDEDTFFNIIWRVMHGRSGPFARHRSGGHAFPVNWYTETGWRKDEARHIAYCWEPGRDWWVIDGVKMEATRQHKTLNIHINEDSTIVFGLAGNGSRFVIDDLRISSRPRAEQEVGFHLPGRLRSDPWTLLLDTFDEAVESDAGQQTQPKVMTPAINGVQAGGLLSKNAQVVAGENGKALAF